jgi:hypothetical protein
MKPRIIWAREVAMLGEPNNACGILVGKLLAKFQTSMKW